MPKLYTQESLNALSSRHGYAPFTITTEAELAEANRRGWQTGITSSATNRIGSRWGDISIREYLIPMVQSCGNFHVEPDEDLFTNEA